MNKIDILNFKENNTYFGDPMPLYYDGVYHLYYLKLNEDSSLSWAHIKSTDMINFFLCDDVIEKGDELDVALFTGSVFVKDNVFHAYYAGMGIDGKPNMLESISYDGDIFTKTNKVLFKRNKYYRADDTWRDPYVFYNKIDNLYHMIFCAKAPYVDGDLHPGVIGHAISTDLNSWKLKKPLTSPHIATTMECPQIIDYKDKYLLIYYFHNTRIRVSNNPLKGYKRYSTESPNSFDFMAAKALKDDKNRIILFGWIPRKNNDSSERIWGGNLAIPRELFLDNKNNPRSKFVDEVYSYYPNKINVFKDFNYIDVSNNYKIDGNKISVNSKNEGSILSFNYFLDNYLLKTNINIKNKNGLLIFYIRTNRDNFRGEFSQINDLGYQIILDFSEERLFIREHYHWDQRPNLLDHKINIKTKKDYSFLMSLNNDILEIELNKEETISFRLLKHVSSGSLSIEVDDISLSMNEFTIFTR